MYKKRVFLSLFLGLFLSGCGPLKPMFARWDGEADLARAENAKKVQIEDAKGKKEAASLLADAEVARAKGVAAANHIIGDSLNGHESYLRYLYIMNLAQAEQLGATIVYVPTEAGLPILEAGRMGLEKEKK